MADLIGEGQPGEVRVYRDRSFKWQPNHDYFQGFWKAQDDMEPGLLCACGMTMFYIAFQAGRIVASCMSCRRKFPVDDAS